MSEESKTIKTPRVGDLVSCAGEPCLVVRVHPAQFMGDGGRKAPKPETAPGIVDVRRADGRLMTGVRPATEPDGTCQVKQGRETVTVAGWEPLP